MARRDFGDKGRSPPIQNGGNQKFTRGVRDDRPYYLQYCVDGRNNINTNTIDPVKFLNSISNNTSMSECIISLTGEKGKEALKSAITRLDYDSITSMNSLLQFLDILGSKENFCGTFKIGIIEICHCIMSVYGFSESLFNALRTGKATNLNPICWFIFIVISSDQTDTYRKMKSVDHIIEYLKFTCNSTAVKLLNNLSSATSILSTEELKNAEPMHDNDFPDDYRKIIIFPTKQELKTDSPAYRGWNGDSNAYHTELLDRQFRYMREDMIAPLKEELRYAYKRKHTMLKDPIINRMINTSCPSFLVSFLIPDYIKTRYKTDKEISKFLINDGDRIYSPDSVILFLRENEDNKTYELCNLGTLVKYDIKGNKVIDGRMTLAVTFQPSDAKDILTAIFTRGQADRTMFTHAIIARVSFFAYKPILECLRDSTLIPLEEELVNSPPIMTASTNTITIPSSIEKLLRNDISQLNALTTALAHRVSLIQGPPGTGKTFLGIQVVKSILASSPDAKILCLCYTNHALDSFLESLLDNDVPSSAIVRLGSYKKISTRLQDCKFDNTQSKFTSSEHLRHIYYQNKKKEYNEIIDKIFNDCAMSIQPHKSWNIIKHYIEHNYYEIYSQLLVPETTSNSYSNNQKNATDFTPVNNKGKKVKEDDYFKLWYDGKSNPAGPASRYSTLSTIPTTSSTSIDNIWEIPVTRRQEMVLEWIYNIIDADVTSIQEYMQKYVNISTEHRNLRDAPDSRALVHKPILACTTTYAAKNHALIDGYGATTILIEEAAEIHESHILINLNPHVKRLIMIGDHKQLRPKLESYPLRTDSGQGINFDKSLFERLIDSGYKYSTLLVQHRMRPEISQMIRHTYPHLVDAERVQGRDNIKGVQKNIVFIDHRQLENSDADILDMNSKTNLFEVKFIMKMVTFLLQQGYQSEDITILTPYLGQLGLFRKELKNHAFNTVINDLDDADYKKNSTQEDLDESNTNNTTNSVENVKPSHSPSIRVATIDNYQGEESKIILASLVRSNDTGDIGFMSGPERVNVLFSRARDGFYIIGNSETFLNAKNMSGRNLWKKIITTLQQNQLIYDGLPIECNKHHIRQLVKTPEEFSIKCPDGGCNTPCSSLLSCSYHHKCIKLCHPDIDHEKIRCRTEIEYQCTRGLHRRKRLCYESESMLPPCKEQYQYTCTRNHTLYMRCGDEKSKKECMKCIDIDKKSKAEEVKALAIQEENEKKLYELQISSEKAQLELNTLMTQKTSLLNQKSIESEIIATTNKISKMKIDIDTIKNSKPPKVTDINASFESNTKKSSTITKISDTKASSKKEENQMPDDKDKTKEPSSSPNKITPPIVVSNTKDNTKKYEKKNYSNNNNDDNDNNGTTTSKPSSKDHNNSILKKELNKKTKIVEKNDDNKDHGKDIDDDDDNSSQSNDSSMAESDDIHDSVWTESKNDIVIKDYSKVLIWIKAEEWIRCLNLLKTFYPTVNIDNLPMNNTTSSNTSLVFNIFILIVHMKLGEDTTVLKVAVENIRILYESNLNNKGLPILFKDKIGVTSEIVAKLYHYIYASVFHSLQKFKNLAQTHANKYLALSETDILPTIWKSEMIIIRDQADKPTTIIPVKDSIIEKWKTIIRKHGKSPSKAMNSLLQMTGLETVKNSFLQLYQSIILSKEQGKSIETSNFNTRFDGNPGTGKTTVAKLYCRFCVDIGLLPQDASILMRTGSELATKGVTSLEGELTKLGENGGGIVFVDEAYQLDSTQGHNILDFILGHSEKLQGKFGLLIWVFAGYKNKIDDLFKHNVGLPSRFPHTFLFEDYTNEELYGIFKGLMDRGGADIKVPTPEPTKKKKPTTLNMPTNNYNSYGYNRYNQSRPDEIDEWGNTWHWDPQNYTFYDDYDNITGLGKNKLGTSSNPLVSRTTNTMWLYDRMQNIWYDKNDSSKTRTTYPGKPEVPKVISNIVFTVTDVKWIRVAVARLGRLRNTIGFGNARAVRNLFDLTHKRQVKRISDLRNMNFKPDIHKFERNDLLGPKATKPALEMCDAWKELNKMEGLGKVKKSVEDLLDLVVRNADREEEEKPLLDIALNRVFLGNPGTGKTTVAKLYAQILTNLGMLSKGEVLFKTASDFVGGAIGKSEEVTNGILEQAKGSVLVIDEAYGFYSPTGSGNDPYREAVINTLVEKVQGVPGDDRVVLLLGYREEMELMMSKCNPGLSRRFQMEDAFEFEDYDDVSLVRILRQRCREQGLIISTHTASFAIKRLGKARAGPHFGNAGAVNNLLSTAKLRMQRRKATDDKFVKEDFVEEGWTDEIISEKEMFDKLVGCESIKKQLQEYRSLVECYRKVGKNPLDVLPFNFLFTGAPGTGKTTVARLMGKMFCSLEMISSDEVIEISASDMMTDYVGQTGKKTTELFTQAKGKVLFIDEAYQLNPAKGGTFMQEAVDEIVKNLTSETFKGKMVVILAGYRQDIDDMLKVNQGLQSRFTERVHFDDFSEVLIGELIRKRLKLTEDGDDHLPKISKKLKSMSNFSNGRDIDTYVKKVEVEIAKRYTRDPSEAANVEDLDNGLVAMYEAKGLKKGEDISEEELFSKLVGCEPIKKQLRDYRSLVEFYRSNSKDPLDVLPFNFLFTGAPGTGKTTVARLMGKMFCSLEMIPSDEVIEISASDMMTGYVGQTGKKTTELFTQAKGKVLFIDEAYQLNPAKGGTFMQEAVDEIVKNLTSETFKGKMVVILAGYRQDIDDMLKVNQGLQSRFTERVHFDDFSEVLIGELIRKRLKLTEDGDDHLPKISKKLKSMSNFSNGRDIDTYVKKVEVEIAKRYTRDPSEAANVEDLDNGLVAMYEAKGLKKGEDISEEELFSKLVGCEPIKKQLRDYRSLVEFYRSNSKDPLDVLPFNFLFTGAPGTGKTTVARLMGKMFCSLEMIPSDEVIEISASDMMTGYVGQTGKKTTELFTQAKGKVLFIDEAYQLNPAKGGSFMQEAVDEVVKNLTSETFKGKMVVILAGYRQDIDEMLKVNQGLQSRFTERVHFDDFSEVLIGELIRKRLKLTEDGDDHLPKISKKLKSMSNFSNGRDIDTYVKKVEVEIAKRYTRDPSEAANVEDLDNGLVAMYEAKGLKKGEDISEEELFSKLVGCEPIKKQLRDYRSLVEFYRSNGKDPLDVLPFNFLFTGAPGTGKTTVARLMGKMFCALEMIPSDEVIEISASDMMTGYVGQTGKKTTELFTQAKGKVLFIDEAYQLNPAKGGTFMQEAVDEIVKNLTSETFKGKMVVILAGYRQDIDEMLKVNQGLQSRFTERVHFDDFSEVLIGELIRKRLKLTEDGEDHLPKISKKLKSMSNFSNGRDIDTYVKKVEVEIAKRYTRDPSEAANVEDLDNALNGFLSMRVLSPVNDIFSSPPFQPPKFMTQADNNKPSLTPHVMKDVNNHVQPPQSTSSTTSVSDMKSKVDDNAYTKIQTPPDLNSFTDIDTVVETATILNTTTDINTAMDSCMGTLTEPMTDITISPDIDGDVTNPDPDVLIEPKYDPDYKRFIRKLQDIVEERGLNTEKGIKQLDTMLDNMTSQISIDLDVNVDMVRNMLIQWRNDQEKVRKQVEKQKKKEEIAKKTGEKTLVPIWRCAVCGRADLPYIFCYVSPYIVRYAERELK